MRYLHRTAMWGSPPPMRGKASPNIRQFSSPQDHPRLCGEKLSMIWSVAPETGSPPPMRGKDSSSLQIGDHLGITPAYAGKSNAETGEVKSVGDHPRLCGEKHFQHLLAYTYKGSPPPMRGKVKLLNSVHNHFRITPAYAGKSCHCIQYLKLY